MFVGTLTAVVVDSAALAYEKVPATAGAKREPTPRTTVTATVALGPSAGAIVGLSGDF
jgi:hypothetical protein